MRPFNVRVYGILLTPAREVLLVREKIKGMDMTKFPGGGLEFGEGVTDCLKREWQEETGKQLTSWEHFYTTEFFQPSAFDPNDQVISIYYRVETNELPNDVPDTEAVIKDFVYRLLDELTEDELTMPIDKVVVRKLKAECV